jgi:arylformamidase
VASLSLDCLVGEAQVLAIDSVGAVASRMLEHICPVPAPRLLMRAVGGRAATGLWLTEDAAGWLISRDVVLIGTEGLSIENPESHDLPVHRLLLSANCVILEGCVLDRVAPGRYTLVAAPLPWRGAEAAPARALLLET